MHRHVDDQFSMTRNVRIVPDHPSLQQFLSKNGHGQFDILVLPGGAPGAKTFSTDETVLQTIANFREAGRWVAAICAGTTALVAAEKKYEQGKVKVTSHPSVAKEVAQAGWEYSEERCVVDGKVITSRG